jgi:hypothetical protein
MINVGTPFGVCVADRNNDLLLSDYAVVHPIGPRSPPRHEVLKLKAVPHHKDSRERGILSFMVGFVQLALA